MLRTVGSAHIYRTYGTPLIVVLFVNGLKPVATRYVKPTAFYKLLGHSIGVYERAPWTHPVYASLDHPLSEGRQAKRCRGESSPRAKTPPPSNRQIFLILLLSALQQTIAIILQKAAMSNRPKQQKSSLN